VVSVQFPAARVAIKRPFSIDISAARPLHSNKRTFIGSPVTSALCPIMLQNSQNAVRLIFREKTKQAAIVDRCSLKRATEVSCKFVTG
jgi:hypothetical protein